MFWKRSDIFNSVKNNCVASHIVIAGLVIGIIQTSLKSLKFPITTKQLRILQAYFSIFLLIFMGRAHR